MKTNPEKCKECKYKETPNTEEPCFLCTRGDLFDISQKAWLERILKESEDQWNKWRKTRRCTDGRMCYCAPFENDLINY